MTSEEEMKDIKKICFNNMNSHVLYTCTNIHNLSKIRGLIICEYSCNG